MDDKLAYLLWRRDFLSRQIRKTSPKKNPIHYRSLLSQLDEVEHELLGASKTRQPSGFSEWFKSVFIPKYLRVFRWLVLGLSCLVGGVYVLN